MPKLSFDRYLSPESGGESSPTSPVSAPTRPTLAIEEAVRRLPPLPTMMTELLREMGSVDADIGALEERISRDPTLTTRLLRMANSAFYAPAADVCAVGQSLMILGLKSARNLVLATAMRAVLGQPRTASAGKSGGIFEHSVAVAVAASRIGSRFDELEDLEESLFVAGLLHDIGMVALAGVETAGPRVPELHDDPDGERAVFGLDHLEVGRLVHAHWNLPDELLGPITRHHETAESLRDDRLATAIALADAHTDHVGHGVREHEEEDTGPHERRARLAASLGIEDGRLDDHLQDLDEEINSFMGSLR